MATTYIYLSAEDLEKLASGDRIDIDMTAAIKNSNKLYLVPEGMEEEE